MGGALGIGGGISRRLAAAGAHVVLADINADAASASHDDITAAGGRCTVVVGDMEVDHEFARAAGCRVVLVPGGSRTGEELARLEPDGFLESISKLPAWIAASRT